MGAIDTIWVKEIKAKFKSIIVIIKEKGYLF